MYTARKFIEKLLMLYAVYTCGRNEYNCFVYVLVLFYFIMFSSKI